MNELTYMLLSLLGFAVAIAILSAVAIRVCNRYWPELSYIDDAESYDNGFYYGYKNGFSEGVEYGLMQAELPNRAGSSVTAAMVKELRAETGRGLVECRNALVATKGNMENAATLLREPRW